MTALHCLDRGQCIEKA